MTTRNFELARRSFAHAIECIRTRPTEYEGLYEAHIESLSCIDVHLDLPPRLKFRYSKWLEESAPTLHTGETCNAAVLRGVRRMSLREVNEQIAKLVVMSRELEKF